MHRITQSILDLFPDHYVVGEEEKAKGLAELLFPAGKITEAFYNRRNAKKALFNFTLHAAEDGLVYIKISNIVIPSKRRRTGNIVPFMKSPVTWLRTAHLLSRDELPNLS